MLRNTGMFMSLNQEYKSLTLCFRPRCPQVDVDVRHLLRIPEDFTVVLEAEDEFECLNLEITCPPVSSVTGPLPVLVWIHGGSQVVTFCSAQSKICGMFKSNLD